MTSPKPTLALALRPTHIPRLQPKALYPWGVQPVRGRSGVFTDEICSTDLDLRSLPDWQCRHLILYACDASALQTTVWGFRLNQTHKRLPGCNQ